MLWRVWFGLVCGCVRVIVGVVVLVVIVVAFVSAAVVVVAALCFTETI